MGEKSRSSYGTTKLFVGNLRAACKRRDLLSVFEAFGAVKECDIIKNFAFVHYENREEAQAAVAALDNSDFQGTTIRVEMSTSRGRQQSGGDQPESTYTSSRQPALPTKLFVGNLPDGCVSEDLKTVFEMYGRVTECDIIKNYAFIHYEDIDNARMALELDDSDFQGSKIRVEMSTGRGRQQMSRASEPVASTKLFVGNLPEDCTQKDLQGAFEVHGEVTECDIIKNYAFVHFRQSHEALDALAALDNSNFLGNTIKVELSTSQVRQTGVSKVVSTKLFVGNVPEKCKRKDLLGAFEKFGKVIECDIIKQYAFVHYDTGAEANAAVAAMDNSLFMGAKIKVELSTCKSKNQQGRNTCFRCGKEGHWSKDCRSPAHNFAHATHTAVHASADVFSSAVCVPGAVGPMGTYGRLRDPYAQEMHDYRDRPYMAIDRFRPYEDPYERRVHAAAAATAAAAAAATAATARDAYYTDKETYMRTAPELYILRRSPTREYYSLYGGDAMGVSAAPAPPRY